MNPYDNKLSRRTVLLGAAQAVATGVAFSRSRLSLADEPELRRQGSNTSSGMRTDI